MWSTGRAGGGSRSGGAPRRAPGAAPGLAHRRLAGLGSGPTVHARRYLERGTQVTDSLALGGGRHHFFVAISSSIALSSIASARSFLSFTFSSSSAFSRLASDTSSPPYLPFHL